MLAEGKMANSMKTDGNQSQQLMQRVSQLQDEDLLRMVFIDSAQYKQEALTYAKAEIERRGVSSKADIIENPPSTASLALAALGRSIWLAIKPKSPLGVKLAAIYLLMFGLTSAMRFTASGEDPIKMAITGLLVLPAVLLFRWLGVQARSDSEGTALLIACAILNAFIIYFATLFIGTLLKNAKRRRPKPAA